MKTLQKSSSIALTAALLLGASLVSAKADTVLVANIGNNTIEKYDSVTGADLGLFANTGLNQPFAMTFDHAGNLYVANWTTATIEKFSLTGQDLGAFATNAQGVIDPMGMAFDQAGNLYASNYSGSAYYDGGIIKLDSSGNSLGMFADPCVNRLGGLAIDASGNLYAANFSGGGAIYKYSPAGTYLGAITGGLGQVSGLTFDKDGNLYAANYGGWIRKFSPDGTDLGNFATTGLIDPLGIAFDSAGDLYAVNYYYGKTVEKYGSDGSYLGTFASSPTTLTYVVVEPEPVPEPSAFALIGCGLAALAAARRFRRK